MVNIEVQGDEAIVADFKDYPRRTDLAMLRAINRALSSARTVMVREIAGDTRLKSGDVRAALPLQEATGNRPVGRLAASLKRIPLIKFGARGPEPSRGKGRGVSYALGRSRGRVESAFVATMKSGHRGVFARAGKKRLPVHELHGPSLGHVFRKHRSKGIARAQEVFEKTFDHEMKFRASADVGAD
jgi:hypothetical protein